MAAAHCSWSHLLPAVEEEVVGINAIGDGTADKGYPMEDQRRLVLVLQQNLRQDIEEDGGGGEACEGEEDDEGGGGFR